jgi:hypothetical protein
LAWCQSPPSPGLHNAGHLIELVNVEHNVDAVVAVLHYSDAVQCNELVGDRTPVIGAGSEVVAAVGVDVALPARDGQQPRIVEPAMFAALGLVTLFVTNLVKVTEANL